MECAAIGILALSGIAAIAAMLALAFGRHVVSALDSAFSKWRRLGFLGRIVTAAMVVVATVEAQKSGESEKSKSQVEVEQRTSNNSIVQLGLPTSTHFLVSVKTNDSYSYSMSENAVRYPNWWLRGGYEDVFKLELGDFSFPIGTNLVDYLWVYTWGKVRPMLKATELEIAAVDSPMSAVPQVSEFWYMDGTNSSKILTWHNFFQGRVFNSASPTDSITPTLTQSHPFSLTNSITHPFSQFLLSAQLELFPNGDYIARSNLVARYFKRVNPDDWDDDGIPNDADVNPSESDGDFFGPQEDELPEGAEVSNYCWVDIVVSNANSLVTFVGDKLSNLPDPRFIAKAGTTHRVNLLIGKTYRVSSALPIHCMAKSSDEIHVSGEGTKEMTVVYPVSYEIMDNARSVSRQVRMIPPLVGTFNWGTTNRCCDIGNVSGAGLPSCSLGCTCEGCASGGFTFNYEGYSLSFDGLECGCKPYSGPTEDDGPYDASASVGFSEKAIIFEDAYENKPGESVSKQSTRTVLSCVAHGGPNGGRARFTISNAEKLVRLSGIDLPMEVDVPAGHKVEFNIVYEGGEASGSENDIVATAQFIDNKDGVLAGVTDSVTSVRVELRPVVVREGCEKRHIWGIGEVVECEMTPKLDRWSFIVEGAGMIKNFAAGYSHYTASMDSSDNHLKVECDGVLYIPEIRVYEPEKIIVGKAVELLYGLNDGSAGGIGMQLELYLHPTDVSFSRIEAMEVPSSDNSVSGYFLDVCFSNMWSHSTHNGAGEWHNVGSDNFFFNDEACMGDVMPKPWEDGVIIWNIPVKYRSHDLGSDEYFTLPVQYTQGFFIDAMGTVRVEKFGLWVERYSSGERHRSKGVDKCE